MAGTATRLYDKRSSGPREAKLTSNNVAQLFDLVAQMHGSIRNLESSVSAITSIGYVSGGGVLNYHAVWDSPTSVRASDHVYDDNVNDRTGFGTVAPVERVHIVDNLVMTGNCGVGDTTLEAWNVAYRALQVGPMISLVGHAAEAAGESLSLMHNAYIDGVGRKRIVNDEAGMYYQEHGAHYFYYAPAAAPDVVFTWSPLALLEANYWRVYYDAANYVDQAISATGDLTITPTGTYVHVPDDIARSWGGTVAGPDATMTWDTTPARDSLILKTPNFVISDTADIGAGGFVDIYQYGCPSETYLLLRNGRVAHGITDYLPTDAFFSADLASSLYGGVDIVGACEDSYNESAMSIWGIAGCSATEDEPYIRFIAGKKSGTGITNVGNSATVLQVKDYYQSLLTVKGDGATTIAGTLTLSTVANAGVDTDKFLVLDASNNVDFRTGAELLSDIGAAAATSISGTMNYLAKFGAGGNNIIDSIVSESGTVLTVGGSTVMTGNCGVGDTTLESWDVTYRVLQVGPMVSLMGHAAEAASESLYLMHNAYKSAGIWMRIVNDEATAYQQESGEHFFYYCPAGLPDVNFFGWSILAKIAPNYLRLNYDASEYVDQAISASGDLTITPTGTYVHVPDDIARSWGNTVAGPDATMTWDTTPARDSLILKTPNFVISDTADIGAGGFVDIYQYGCPSDTYFVLRNGNVAHGITSYLPTDAFFGADIKSSSYGGVNLIGACEDIRQTSPLTLYGITQLHYSDEPNPHPYIKLIAGKKTGGTVITNVGDSVASIFQVLDYDEILLEVKGNGATTVTGEFIANGNSKVEASSTTAQAMANTAYTTVVFGIEDKDLLGEYDHTTGIFTAGKDGTYAVSWNVASVSAAWSVGEYWSAKLSRNNSTAEGDSWDAVDWARVADTYPMFPVGSAIVTLSAGETLRVKVYHNQGAAVNTSGLEQQCYFHIDRIA